MKKILVMLMAVIGVAVSGGAGAGGWVSITHYGDVATVGVLRVATVDEARAGWNYPRLLKQGFSQADLDTPGAFIMGFNRWTTASIFSSTKIPFGQDPVYVPPQLRGQLNAGDIIALRVQNREEQANGATPLILGVVFKAGTPEAEYCQEGRSLISKCSDQIPDEWIKPEWRKDQ